MATSKAEEQLTVEQARIALAELERERNRLRAELQSHRDAAAGSYWVWQGDGTDNLESRVCPVLIRPWQLHALVAKAEKAYKQEREQQKLAEVKSGYHALEKNWHTVHEAAMSAIRQTVGKPNATVPEIVEWIAELEQQNAELVASVRELFEAGCVGYGIETPRIRAAIDGMRAAIAKNGGAK